MHIPGRSGTATMEVLLSRWGRRRPGRAYTASSSITSRVYWALFSTRTVSCFSLHENNFFGFEWEWPCSCRLPSEASPMTAHSELNPAWPLGTAKDGCSLGRAQSVEKGGRSPAPPWCWRRAPVPLGEAKACLQQHRERPEPGEEEGDKHPSRATAVGSSSILRGNLEPTSCRRRGLPVVA